MLLPIGLFACLWMGRWMCVCVKCISLIAQLPVFVGKLTGMVSFSRTAVSNPQYVIVLTGRGSLLFIYLTGWIMYSVFLQLRPTSIEKEVFPEMAEDGNLFAMELKGRATCFLG